MFKYFVLVLLLSAVFCSQTAYIRKETSGSVSDIVECVIANISPLEPALAGLVTAIKAKDIVSIISYGMQVFVGGKKIIADCIAA